MIDTTVFNDKSIFSECAVLSALSAEDIQLVYERSERVTFIKGDKEQNIIFDKGDVGNSMYILIDGIVDITTIDHKGRENVLTRYKEPSDFFGEQALFDSLKNRTARAVVVSETCVLRKIGQKEFDNIILAKQKGLYEVLSQQGRDQLKRGSFIFSAFLEEHIKGQVKEERIKQGTLVFQEGEAAGRFYLILSGRAKVFRNNVFIANLIAGNYFGDEALINQQEHHVSIKADNDLVVSSVDGAVFQNIYQSSQRVRDYIQSMAGFNYNDGGVIYLQHHSHYNNQKSLTTTLTYPNGQACSITRVIGKPHVIKIAKQIDIFDSQDEILGKQDIELLPGDLLILPEKNVQFPKFYLKNNQLIGAEFDHEYAYLNHIIPSIIKSEYINCLQKGLYRTNGNLWVEAAKKDPTDKAIVCACTETTRGELKALVAFGYDTTESLASKTGASLGCGSCRANIAEIASSSAKVVPAKLLNSKDNSHFCNELKNIKYFRFKPEQGLIEDYFPGQHIRLETKIAGQWIQRAYTLTSDAQQKEYYEIAVRRTKGGVISNWLHDKLTTDSVFSVSKPQGLFYLNTAVKTPVICLVAGVGITPAIAFLRYFVSGSHKNPLIIDYTVSTDADIAFKEELKADYPSNITTIIRVTERRKRIDAAFSGIDRRENPGKNRITEKNILQLVEQHPGANFYLCGSHPFEEAVQTYLLRCHVKTQNIHSEQFDKSEKGKTALLAGSITILLMVLVFFAMPSYQIPSSVTSFDSTQMGFNVSMMWDNFSYIRQTYFPRDITGYSILGIGLLAFRAAGGGSD